MEPPLSASEVCIRDPSLINIQDPFSGFQELQKLDPKLLAQDQVLLRIAIERDLFDLLKCEAEPITQHMPNLAILQLDLKVSLQIFSNAGSFVNVLELPKPLLNRLLNLLHLKF